MSMSDTVNEISAGTLARLKSRKVAALTEVYEAYGARIYSICRRLAGNAPDADDITQEVLLRILEQAGSYAGKARFSTWVFRLTINLARNHLKAAQLHQGGSLLTFPREAGPEDAAPGPTEIAIRREESAQLDSLLQALPMDQRSVLILRELEGMSYAEIGEVLGLPMGTVTSRICRGRRSLADLMTHGDPRNPSARDGIPRRGCPSEGSA